MYSLTVVLHVIRKNQQKKHTCTRDYKHEQKCTREHPRAKHFKDDGTWVCPVCLYHDMFLKEEMKEAWAIVENASISWYYSPSRRCGTMKQNLKELILDAKPISFLEWDLNGFSFAPSRSGLQRWTCQAGDFAFMLSAARRVRGRHESRFLARSALSSRRARNS